MLPTYNKSRELGDSMNIKEYFRELEVKETKSSNRTYKRINVKINDNLESGKVYIVNEQEYHEIIETFNTLTSDVKDSDKKIEVIEQKNQEAIQILKSEHNRELSNYQSRIKELEDELDDVKEKKNNDRIIFNNTLTKINSLGIIDVLRNKHKRISDDSRLLVEPNAKVIEHQTNQE